MYVLEHVRSGGKIETETGTLDQLMIKLYTCDPRDVIQPTEIPKNHKLLKAALVISVNPGRSEGRYLYEMPDLRLSA